MTFPERNHIIVNHSGFMPPLRSALESRGLVLDDDIWDPSEEQLEKTLACHVWFYDCLRHPLRVWRLKRRCRKHNVPLFAWNRDAPHYLNRSKWRLAWLDWIRLLDVYASHSLIDKRTFADTVIYLPNAADIDTYHPSEDIDALFLRLRDPQTYTYDVSFFGGMDGHRYKEDAARQDFFTTLSKRLADRNISFLFCEAEGMSVTEQIKLIHSSRINLNFGARCEYQAPIASGLPERCYGIPACGGFLLCDKRTHARDDFVIGENWAEFDGLDDCVAKIEYWLSHFDQARKLAERCHHHVMTHHTYAQRAATLHNALCNWHEQNRRTIV